MKLSHFLSILAITILGLTSCSKKSYKFKLDTPKKATVGEKVNVTLQQISGDPADSIHVYFGQQKLSFQNNKAEINTANFGVGKHQITALAFVPGKVKKVRKSIEVFSNKKPDLYSFKIINTFPHDKESFTQGLEYYNGFLYETTGRKGQSWLRKIDIKTGEVLQQYDLSDKYFGEGMTIFNNEIFWLTWHAKKGFIFDLETFKLKKEFPYNKSNEGWGLTHSTSELIKSDGSNKIWFLNPQNQKEQRNIQVYTNDRSLEKLNELEFINGKIYANYWQKPLIAMVNPDNGIVEGIIDLRNLVKEMEKTQKLVNDDDVLNGIAYDADNNRLFVTGKRWNKLFEIEIIKQ